MMKELKEVSIYPPQVQASFGYDNETIMSYKVKMNNVPVQRLSDTWHFKHVEQPLAAYTKGTRRIQNKQAHS